MKNYKAKLGAITTFVFDYDGVLSDSSVMVTDNGDFIRRTNVKDGYALQLAVRMGYNIIIISGANALGMRKRLEALNISEIHLGVSNKLEKYTEIKSKLQISDEEIIYMGDDIPDYEVMRTAGLAACPSDAVTEIKEISEYISDKRGGEGCARDIIEQTMKIHKKWLTEVSYNW